MAELASSGLSNREIAAALNTSVRTVSNHLVAVYSRLGVNNRSDLADMPPSAREEKEMPHR